MDLDLDLDFISYGFGFGFGLEILDGFGHGFGFHFLWIWIWIWTQFKPWIGLDFGFKLCLGFGLGFGFKFTYGFKSKSKNPNPYSSTYNVREDIVLGDISSLSCIDQKSPKFGTFQITLLSGILNLVKLHKYTIFHNVIFIRQSTLMYSFLISQLRDIIITSMIHRCNSL